MAVYYSPTGNGEIWNTKPEGYYTEAEWFILHPLPEPKPDPEPTPPTLEEIKAAKLAAILNKANQAYQQVTARYSVPEQISWEKQKEQAEALIADANAEAPLVRSLAENRGIPVLEFAHRILNNALQAETATSIIIMQQQAYEDRLAAALTVEQVQAIVVTYNLTPWR